VTAFNVTAERITQDFEAIFREHYSLIYCTAYSVTGSTQDAEDVLQDIFLWLLRRGIPSDLRDFRAYLYRAAVNSSLNIVRSRKRQISTDDVEQEGSGNDAVDDRRMLMNAMTQLDDRSVELLILRYEHGYSDAEIAKLLGRSRGVVAVALHRARARLKKIIRASSTGR
jgi:RNA polymerase sigma-70 factor (ECF subfamily)